MASDEVRQAQQALNRIREDLMSRPEVRAVFVGLLPDQHGVLGKQVGIRVVVDAAAVESELQLPRSIEGFPVRVERGAPAPEGRLTAELERGTEGGQHAQAAGHRQGTGSDRSSR